MRKVQDAELPGSPTLAATPVASSGRRIASELEELAMEMKANRERQSSPEERSGALPAGGEAAQKVARPVVCELLPLPIPFPKNEVVESERIRELSRAVRSRVKRRVGWQGWANAGVRSINEIFGKTASSEGQESAVYDAALFFVTNLRCLSGDRRCRVQFFRGSLQSALRFSAWLHWESVSNRLLSMRASFPLSDPGAKMANCSSLLTRADSEAWRDWRRVLVRSPSEFQDVIAREGLLLILTQSSKGNLRVMPGLFAMWVCVVSFHSGRPLRPLSVFLWSRRKLGKQTLIFDTRRVNQHFRRPWHCALPESWAGLQLPSDSAYHMAQT